MKDLLNLWLLFLCEFSRIFFNCDRHWSGIGANNHCIEVTYHLCDHFSTQGDAGIGFLLSRILILVVFGIFWHLLLDGKRLLISIVKNPLITSKKLLIPKGLSLHLPIFLIHIISIILFVIKVSFLHRIQTIVFRVFFWISSADSVGLKFLKQFIIVVFVVYFIALNEWVFEGTKWGRFYYVMEFLVFNVWICDENVRIDRLGCF